MARHQLGLVALLLCAIGIYRVLAYAVSQRTKEIGIRVALGSTSSRIFGLIAQEGALLIATGLGLGALGALALKQSIEGQLFDTQFSDTVVWRPRSPCWYSLRWRRAPFPHVAPRASIRSWR